MSSLGCSLQCNLITELLSLVDKLFLDDLLVVLINVVSLPIPEI
jgi:hypothetical protein